jgi:hypothetical protein
MRTVNRADGKASASPTTLHDQSAASLRFDNMHRNGRGPLTCRQEPRDNASGSNVRAIGLIVAAVTRRSENRSWISLISSTTPARSDNSVPERT